MVNLPIIFLIKLSIVWSIECKKKKKGVKKFTYSNVLFYLTKSPKPPNMTNKTIK